MFNKNPVLNTVFRTILIFSGCFLLLVGNTLPWPCYPGSWYGLMCDSSLDVWFVSESVVSVFIAAITLMLMLEINLLEGKLGHVAWVSYWIVLYLFLVAKIRTDSLYPNFHYTWVHFNASLLTFAVTPLSLLAYWLALRPKDIRQKYRKWTLACLLALVLSTTFFLLFAMLAMDLHLRFSFEIAAAIRTAPVSILTGGLLLLGVEYIEMMEQKRKTEPEQEEIEKED